MSETFREDMTVVKEIMDKFIAQDHISKGLKHITEIGITGWEKWWQIELAIFLDDYPKLKEWDMEHEFEVDRRKYDGDRLYVDFGFTMDGWNNDYVFLELKQNNDYKKCIDSMFKDAEKYEILKDKSISGVRKRNVFVVGFFRIVDWNDISEYFLSCMDHYEFDFSNDDYLFLEAKVHEWGMVIF